MTKPKKNAAARRQAGETAGRPPFRVLIVDDHPLMLKGIRALIDGQPDMTCCGEAATAREALEQADRTCPDMAVLDLSLPGNSGIALLRDLKTWHPGLRILVLSMHDETLYAEKAIRAGASGYVMKQDAPERLLEGMRSVLNGEIFLSRQMASALLGVLAGRKSRASDRIGVAALTERELQVFEGIGTGLTARQLAREYGLSVKTVETHCAHIKRKLGLRDAHHLIHAAIHWTENASAGRTQHRS